MLLTYAVLLRSIRGVLIGEDGTFTFTVKSGSEQNEYVGILRLRADAKNLWLIDPRQVPSKDRYVRKEMFNGQICELEEPRQLHDQVSGQAKSTLNERCSSGR